MKSIADLLRDFGLGDEGLRAWQASGLADEELIAIARGAGFRDVAVTADDGAQLLTGSR